MNEELQTQIERVAGAAERLERLIAQHSLMATDGEASLERVVAMVEAGAEGRRETELTERLERAEKTIAELRASVTETVTHSARRTLPVSLLAKQEGGTEFGAGLIGSGAIGAVDAALASLSPEQRIMVKSQLLRAGLI